MQSDQYDDKPVFDMHTPTLKSSYLNVIGKKKVGKKARGPSIECDGCLALSRDVLIYMYQYITMLRYCDECLREGACETDPDYCSKWELL